MCQIQPVMTPNEKLKKMLVFAKIILIINVLSAFLRIIIRPSDMMYDLFTALFLFMAYNSVYFVYMAIYLIFCFFNSIILFINSGIILQMLIQNTLGDSKQSVPLVLGVQLYLFIFYVFAIVFTFPIYKEMKAQMLEMHGVSGGNQPDEERGASSYGNISYTRPPNTQNTQASTGENASNNNRGFQAFSGRGQVVG